MQRMQPLAEPTLEFLRALVRTWEQLQVELQGQYSPTRLVELHTFTHATSVVRTIAILLLTPAICAVMTVVFDVLPLRPPTGGVYQQSATYWLRIGFVAAVVVSGAILQFQQASPRLPFRRGPFIAATTLIAAAAPVFVLSLHLLIGFPTPFGFQLIGILLQHLLAISFWAMWKTTVRGDTEVQHDLRQFILFYACLTTMVALYPVMIFVFGRLNGIHQALFSFSFPILKLMFRNWASRGLFRIEDLAPIYVVTSIDVFHALLLSCAMESAASRGTLASVMGVDVFQSVVAIVEVRAVVKRLRCLHLEIPHLEAASPVLSQAHCRSDILSVACSLLESHPHTRSDPAVGLPRHRRQVPWRVFSSMSALMPSKRVVRVACAEPPVHVSKAGPMLIKDGSDVKGKKSPEVEFVRFTLKLLHMVEFYLLIEFMEVVVAVVYAIYFTAMFYLPNRAFYPAVRTLTHDEFMETVGQVLQYAALELLSLAMLCVVLDRLLSFSTLRMLAFTLRKHAVLAQSQLTLWVFMSTQFSLEHFGCDYTFQFAWLRRPVEQNIPSGDSPSAT